MAGSLRRPRASHQPSSASPTDTAGLVAGLATVALWGSAFVGIRAAESLSPGALALGRLVVSTVVLTAVAFLRRERLPRPRDLLSIAAYGVLWLAIYSVALNAAERRIDAGTAAMLIATGPILIAVLAGFLLGEGFPPNLFLGCALAFAGSSMIGIGTARSAAPAALGIALCVLAVIAYSLAVVVQKPVLVRVSSFQVIWLGCVAATLVCLPFAPALVSEAAKADLRVIGWVVYLGLFPTAIGFATWGFALRQTTAGRTGSMLYLVPLVAVVLGWALLRETPPVLALVGGAFCLIGVYLARRPSAARQQPLVANEAQANS
ncbi:MAG TPA: DMT family transporter [Candidatus Acidoferrum sp.]|nr:DMT family transporter [Candidatus Acidoferrum sp.]